MIGRHSWYWAYITGVLTFLSLAAGAAAQSVSVMNPATCSSLPRNGELLASRGLLAEGGHVLEIDNGASGNAIIKVRDANSSALLVSFYVEGSQKAQVTGIPDGNYRVQFATGSMLDATCRNFVTLEWAEQFPGAQAFRTERTAKQIITSVLSYTLYEVAGGNVSPQTISAQEFNQP